MDSGLAQKVVLVTGGAGGIGSEVVRALAAEGARVVVHYHRSAEAAQRLLGSLEKNSTLLVSADLTNEDSVESLYQQIEKHWGPVEVVIANAGVWEAKNVPLHEMKLEQWNHTLTTNLSSTFLVLRRFFQAIHKFSVIEPSAVLVGSTAGIYGEAGHSDYAASKSAMIYGLLLSLKNELTQLSPRGRINAISPGWVLTPMVQKFASDSALITKALQTVALRKIARPADIAKAAVFLASTAMSGHVTGQNLVIAGGMEGRVLYENQEIDLKGI